MMWDDYHFSYHWDAGHYLRDYYPIRDCYGHDMNVPNGYRARECVNGGPHMVFALCIIKQGGAVNVNMRPNRLALNNNHIYTKNKTIDN